MAKNPGTAENVLSLPKGGGAQRGLGSTFETDLNTGTGGYSIPIEVPAGPNAIQPRIVIRYHSAAGNGEFGMGWTLGQVGIARKTDGRIPTYAPDDDAFVLLGVEDLLLTDAASNLYRPRVDTLHWHIQRTASGWEMTDPDGTRYFAGRATASRVETIDNGFTKTALWLLDEMQDRSGYAVQYHYRAEDSQRYLENVTWGTYDLRFVYEDRPDPVTSGRYGFLLPTTLRCRRIELHVTTLTPSLARSWTLDYDQAPASGVSLLRRVTLRGHAADGSSADVPPLTLGYSQFEPCRLERFATVVPGMAPAGFEQGVRELVDWDGDGLPDLLELGGGKARVWHNRGRCQWDMPRTLDDMPTPIALNERGVTFADMDSSGTADLIFLDRTLTGYYPLKPGGGFAAPVYWQRAPSARLAEGTARLLDLNGDGVIDMLTTTEYAFNLYYRDGAVGWVAEPDVLPRPAVPPLSFRDPHVFIADMNGDGLADLVRVDGSGVTYYPYLGYGRWAEAVELANPPMLPRNFDPSRLYLSDIDGDGCADLVYVDFERVLYWLNGGGTRLSAMQEIPYTPPAPPGTVRLADMKGGGTAGVLWSPTGAAARRGYLYLDFTGGVKPYLLTTIDNGCGLSSEIDYRPSTDFALADTDAGSSWRTFHPFAVHCVAEIRLRDQVTGQVSSTRHHYHEGRYDGRTRTFLGFRVVDVENVGDDSIPTLLTRNVYHIGLDPDDLERPLVGEEQQRLGALRRRVLRTEYYGIDGSASQERPYQIAYHEYDTRVEAGGVIVPFETRTFEENYEREPTPFAFREIIYDPPDEHGNIPRQQMHAWRAGVLQPDQDVITETTFASNPAAHLYALPARVTQRSGAGELLSISLTLYDGVPHAGLPEGQATTGNITVQQSLALTDSLAASLYGASLPDFAALGYIRRPGEDGWWVTTVSYERQNATTLITRSATGNDSRLEYDATGQYPQQLTDPLGGVMTGTVDERVFQMATYTDINGHEVRDLFDPLGRVIGTVSPGDAPNAPSVTHAYQTAALPIRVETHQLVRFGETATLDDYQYVNGRGELAQRLVNGEGDTGRRYIVEEAREYTTRGQVSVRYLPYYTDNLEYAPPDAALPALRTRFDALGRLVAQEKPDGGVITQNYDPLGIQMLDEADNAGATPTPLVHRVDSLKRVIAVEHHLPNRIVAQQYEYDAANRLHRSTSPDGGATTYTYDLLGRVLAEDTVDAGRVLFTIDPAGNPVTRTTATGKTVRSRFDALERLVEVTQEGEAAPDITYTYLNPGDPAPGDGVRDRIGRVWRVQDRVGTLTFAYDTHGRIVETRRAIDALGGRELVSEVTYDAAGRAMQYKLPEPSPGAGRRIVEYRYNARGLPNNAPSYVQTAEYNVHGNLTRLVYANGTENVTDYNMLTGRPSRIRVLAPGGAVLRDQQFAFDPVGNLSTVTAAHPVESGVFTYDALHQLLTADYGNGDHFAYTYTDGGNITSAQGLGGFTYGGAVGSNAVTAVNTPTGTLNYGYDADGQLRTAPYGTLHFDALDNLTHLDLPGGSTVNYTYDFQGMRVVKRLSDGTLHINADVHFEFHDGAPVQWITFGGKRILAVTNSSAVYLHYDLIGTPTLYTDLAGAQARRIALSPYGVLRFDSGATGLTDEARVGSQPLDGESGLICLGRRYYDPRLGRFISPDRAVPGLYRIDGWNRYSFARNNPLRYTDPTGRFSWGDFFAILGVAIVVAALIVAGFFTGGATWALAAGVVISVKGLLIGVAVGIAAGAVIGGIAAGVAGGEIWQGVLLGGFLGGTAAFAGGTLGALAGGFAGSLLGGSKIVTFAVAGVVQGTFMGAATGAATGFAGGKGSAESVWEHIWKGAIIGAITGLIFGAVSGYIASLNTETATATLRIGTLEKIDPRIPAAGGFGDRAAYISSSFDLGYGATSSIAQGGGSFGAGTFVAVGSGPGSALLNIPIGWLPAAMQYGGITLASSTFVTLDKYNIADFGDVFFFILELAPYVGVVFAIFDDANWSWYEDMQTGFREGLDIPNT